MSTVRGKKTRSRIPKGSRAPKARAKRQASRFKTRTRAAARIKKGY